MRFWDTSASDQTRKSEIVGETIILTAQHSTAQHERLAKSWLQMNLLRFGIKRRLSAKAMARKPCRHPFILGEEHSCYRSDISLNNRSLRKQLPHVLERFEFQRITTRIKQEHCRLFAYLTFEAHVRFDHKLNVL